MNYGLADYLLDNYGDCKAGRCVCLLTGQWIGRGCPNWTPLGVKTWDELGDWMDEQRAREHEQGDQESGGEDKGEGEPSSIRESRTPRKRGGKRT